MIPPPYQAPVDKFDNVFSIRNAADHIAAKPILSSAQNIVVIGGSFLGLEAATSLKKNFPEATITVVEMQPKPLGKIFGDEIAQQMLDLHLANGVRILSGTGAKTIDGNGRNATSVTVSKGDTEEVLPAQAVLVSTGARIQTEAVPANLKNPDGSVAVNSFLQTTDSDIYAAGDIASFPSLLTETNTRIEHWLVAQQQGQVAAHNMLHKGKPYTSAPFFWTNQFGNAQFVGFGVGTDSTWSESDGGTDPAKTTRVTYFFKGQRCIGAATINMLGAALRLKIALERGIMPNKSDFTSGRANYAGIAQSVADSNPCGSGDCCNN